MSQIPPSPIPHLSLLTPILLTLITEISIFIVPKAPLNLFEAACNLPGICYSKMGRRVWTQPWTRTGCNTCKRRHKKCEFDACLPPRAVPRFLSADGGATK